MNAFISWTRADEDIKNIIVERLQSQGITCFDSDQDCNSDFSAECMQAIGKCALFIVLISEASMARGFVKNEVVRAREAEDDGTLNILVYKLTDQPYTDRFQGYLNHISYESGNLIQRKESQNGESSLDRLIRRAQRLLELRQSGDPEKPFEVRKPKPEGVHIVSAGYFVPGSRDDVLAAMDVGFSRSNVLVLREFAGFGKRSTVKQYVQLHRNAFPDAYLLQGNGASLQDFLQTGLEFSNLNERVFEGLEGDRLWQAKRKQLEKLDSNVLIAISDLSLSDSPDDALCQQLLNLKCRIVLLTQNTAEMYDDYFPVIRVGRMANEHLLTLFFHHYKVFEADQAPLEAPLVQFFDNVGGHTRTVELTASVLYRELRIPPARLPEYLSMQGSEGMQLQDKVQQQLSHIFNMANLSQDEYTAMLVAACLAVPSISEQHYHAVLSQCGVTDQSVTDSLDQRRWLDVDLQNRTVSIEPMLVQIVMRKREEYANVLLNCLQYLEQLYMRTMYMPGGITGDAYLHLKHFFRITGLPLLAQLAEILQVQIESGSVEPETARSAVAAFLQTYPAQGWSAEPEETKLVGMERFVYTAQYTARQVLLLPVKLLQFGKADLLTDYSAGATQYAAQMMHNGSNSLAELEEELGISAEELMEWTAQLRKEMDENPDWESADPTSYLVAEGCTAIVAYIRHDGATLQLSVNRLMQLLELVPSLAEDVENETMIFMPMIMLSFVYLKSHYYDAAIAICKYAMSVEMTSFFQSMIHQIFILSLRGSGQYPPEMFESYAFLLQAIDTDSGHSFAQNHSMYQKKKDILLGYAIDLSNANEPEKAIAQFAAAQKLGPLLMPDVVVQVADQIVASLARNGQFCRVAEFLQPYFTGEQLEALLPLVSENARDTLNDLCTYLAFEDTVLAFAQASDTVPGTGYYQKYARENDSTLERKYIAVADKAMDFDFSDLTEEEITDHAATLRLRAKREPMQRLMPEAFALCSEAGYRVLGYRHHHVQYMGAAAMADGKIAEILNGEGKTYTIVLTAFLFHLYGQQVYVVDQSDYLTQRNQNWMQGVYALLGIDCRYIPNQEPLPNCAGLVLYMTLRRLATSYLQQEISDTATAPMPTDCLILDEADTVLVDCALTPCSIVAPQKTPWLLKQHRIAWELVQEFGFDERYFRYHGYQVLLQSELFPILEQHYGKNWSDLTQRGETQRIENIVRTAALCCCVYEKNKDFFIHNGQPVQEDQHTGSFGPFGESYQYFLCLLTGLDESMAAHALSNNGRTISTICLRDLFRKFRNLCGTTATAVSFRKEFKELYGLEYIAVPPHLPCRRVNLGSPLYTALRGKDQAILEMVRTKHAAGQPVLLVTQTVQESEKYSRLLKRSGIEHQLLNARNAQEASHVLAYAGIPGSVVVANALAGRGADIKLGGSPELMTRRELAQMGADLSQVDSFLYRLPTQEQKELPLYQQYYSILEKYRRLIAADRQKVVDAGGLCVISTCLFQEPRNEQQARGRAGRQGDVGESILFCSLEDETLEAFIPQGIKNWAHSMIGDSDCMDVGILDKALRSAQKKLHTLHFAKIRRANDNCRYIDQARADFIEPRYVLLSGVRTVDEQLAQWLTHERVLKLLQNEEQASSCPWLQKLIGIDRRLKRTRGAMAGKLLVAAYKTALEKALPGVDYNTDLWMAQGLAQRLLQYWQDYIDFVLQNIATENTTPQSIEKLLQAEKDRLLLQLLDWPLRLRVQQKSGN